MTEIESLAWKIATFFWGNNLTKYAGHCKILAVERSQIDPISAKFKKKRGKKLVFSQKHLVNSKKLPIFAPAIGKIANASLAQLVEHDTLNVGVQGSSPWGGTEEKNESSSLFFVAYQKATLYLAVAH